MGRGKARGYKRLQVALQFCWDFADLNYGVIHPPPNNRPGPSDAKKMGLRLSAVCCAATESARCNAVPHVEDPRLPDARATSGKSASGTPHCRATSAMSRGFGWGGANAP